MSPPYPHSTLEKERADFHHCHCEIILCITFKNNASVKAFLLKEFIMALGTKKYWGKGIKSREQ